MGYIGIVERIYRDYIRVMLKEAATRRRGSLAMVEVLRPQIRECLLLTREHCFMKSLFIPV